MTQESFAPSTKPISKRILLAFVLITVAGLSYLGGWYGSRGFSRQNLDSLALQNCESSVSIQADLAKILLNDDQESRARSLLLMRLLLENEKQNIKNLQVASILSQKESIAKCESKIQEVLELLPATAEFEEKLRELQRPRG